MFTLILLLVVGSVLVYISRFNYMPVTLNLGSYSLADIPLFYVIVGSLLAGLALSYFIYLINSIFMKVKLRGKDKEIKKNKDELLELTKRVHQLELENEKLKREPSVEPEDTNAL